MTGIDYFAIFVLIVLILTVIVGFIALAMLPGKIAAKNNHPQAAAVNAAGWLGALFGGVFWPLAMVWAMIKSPTLYTDDASANKDLMQENQTLKERISELEAKAAADQGLEAQ